MTMPLRLSIISVVMFALFCLTRQICAEDTAAAYLNTAAQAARGLRTLSADLNLTWQSPGKPIKQMRGSIVLMKPNYALLKLKGDYPLKVLASDGTNLFTFPDTNSYTKTGVDPRGEKINTPWWGMPFRYFFTQSINPFGAHADPSAEINLLGMKTIHGRAFRVVSVHGTRPMVYTAQLYFGMNNVLEYTVIRVGAGTAPRVTFTAELTNITLNIPMNASAFRFTPPVNATWKDASMTDTMLTVGEKAPDFTLPTSQGTTLSLQQARHGVRGTLIDFWYLECAPCRIEFPSLEQLYRRLHSRGFNIVAIDRNDSAKAVTAYTSRSGITFPVVFASDDKGGNIFEQYKVPVFPAAYLLDEQGRIVYRGTGADIAGIRAALVKIGLN